MSASITLGFIAGLVVFLANAFALAQLGGRLLGARPKSAWMVPLLFVAKFALLGVGAYVALVLLDASPYAFVAGAAAALALITLAMVVSRRRVSGHR